MTPYQVSVAAESLIASLLSQAGYNVHPQYGANQPGYDLIASKRGRTLKVSVKGSQNGAWKLVGKLKSGGTYQCAINQWWIKHRGQGLLFAFVQFEGIGLGKMPDVFIAPARDVAKALRSARNGEGYTKLWMKHRWSSGRVKGCTDCIPKNWSFSRKRINSM